MDKKEDTYRMMSPFPWIIIIFRILRMDKKEDTYRMMSPFPWIIIIRSSQQGWSWKMDTLSNVAYPGTEDIPGSPVNFSGTG
jgi:hypothetical protein